MSESLILASSSPRRRALLETLGFRLQVQAPDVDERMHPGEPAAEAVVRIAREKARSVDAQGIVLAADTVVVYEDEIIGKPRDADDARAILHRLAGGWHRVITGYCVREGAREVAASVESEVRLRSLTPAEIAAYVATGEPLDKAGAYGIQERGAALVQEVRGSYSNVVGLPVREVLDTIAQWTSQGSRGGSD